MLPRLRSISLVVVFWFTATVADAGLVVFSDRATWETAAGGSPSINVNFNSFGNDTFVNVPVDVGPCTISSTGSASFIDAAPLLAFVNVNGTPYYVMSLAPNEAVTFTFDTAVFSWGGDFRPFPVDRGETFIVAANNGMSTTITLPTDTPQFRGFISDIPFTSVVFSVSSALSGGDGITRTGVDNISAHIASAPVPEISTILAWGLVTAIASCCWMQRGRGQPHRTNI